MIFMRPEGATTSVCLSVYYNGPYSFFLFFTFFLCCEVPTCVLVHVRATQPCTGRVAEEDGWIGFAILQHVRDVVKRGGEEQADIIQKHCHGCGRRKTKRRESATAQHREPRAIVPA